MEITVYQTEEALFSDGTSGCAVVRSNGEAYCPVSVIYHPKGFDLAGWPSDPRAGVTADIKQAKRVARVMTDNLDLIRRGLRPESWVWQ
jgi:hypothetical protein